jgi:hypothetical protein
VNFISSFNVSGLTRNICNIWSQHNISAGDDLILKLEKLPFATRDGSIKYHLNHWKKSASIQQFRYEDGGVNEGWQLVPAVLSTYTPSRMYENYDYREHGHWHLLRTQVMARNESAGDRRYEASNSGIYHDDRAVMRGALLEGTFEPVWTEYTHWTPQRGVRRPREDQQEPPRRFQPFAGRGYAAGGDGGGGDGGARPGARLFVAAAPDPVVTDSATPSLGIADISLSSSEAPTTTTFVAPKKPRRTLGIAQTQAGAPVVVETVKPN